MSTHAHRPRIAVAHPTGNTFARALIEALEEADLLDSFFTCIATGRGDSNILSRELYGQRRCTIAHDSIRLQPFAEMMRLLTQRVPGAGFLRRHETGLFCVDAIYGRLDRKVARHLRHLRHGSDRPAAVYAYEDGALHCFAAAKERDVRCIYDLPIGYWRAARRIQSEEAELKPEWAATMPALRDSEAKTRRKDEELQLADTIVVASRFTADTLKEAPFDLPEPIVVPYGCPPAREPAQVAERMATGATGARLKVLFVGSLGQRKGLSYLLDAVELMGDRVELTLIGRPSAPCAPMERALQKYRWIESLPHAQILETMSAHDVLVFPSLFEGFGLVLTEALSQGLPIITTSHTAAPDLITEGKEGFIVPIRESEAIAEKLEYLHNNPDELQAMRIAAVETARHHTWRRYQDNMAASLNSLLG